MESTVSAMRQHVENARSVAELIEMIRRGAKRKYLLFWGILRFRWDQVARIPHQHRFVSALGYVFATINVIEEDYALKANFPD